MNIRFSLEYKTRWGESLKLRLGRHLLDMDYLPGNIWTVRTKVPDGEKLTYGYEVWEDGAISRKEWRAHSVTPHGEVKSMEVRDLWLDRPENAPFYSKFFTDVIFARKACRPQTSGGNLTFAFYSPEIRPEQTIAITGSGKHFRDWTKFVVMDDSEFPLWKITLKTTEPFEYKFVVTDRRSLEPLFWENGGNHFCADVPKAGESLVLADDEPVFPTTPWRGAGTAVPVFALRSDESFGVGEFADIKLLVDWAVETGQNVLQLLPVNDTTMTGTWKDSYPYNANSSFALHPQFIRLTDAGVRCDKAYRNLRDRLNALPKEDYEKVCREKDRLLRKCYGSEKTKATIGSDEYKKFMRSNSGWLLPYAVFCCLRDKTGTCDFSKWGKFSKYSEAHAKAYASAHSKEVGFYCWEQFEADRQLKDAVAYAHRHGVALKGDIPIGVSRTSADSWQHPQLFHLDSQAGAPPDAFSVNGQNWGFPTYNWDRMAEDGFAWWKGRLGKMSEYFDAFRIDHILGFFRIWEIPSDCVHGLLGHFNPALPYSEKKLAEMGFDAKAMSRPIMSDWALSEIFGDLRDEAMTKFIKGGKIAPAVDTQRKVEEFFGEVQEGSDDARMKDALMSLLDDVLFVPDPRRKGYYHPRISAQFTLSYRALDDGQKAAYNALYNDFFFRRHNKFWKLSALRKLPSLLNCTRMLACGEDLGMIPDCVPEVMKDLRILSLEIQRMPKSPEKKFGNPAEYPYLCVCATGTHDTSTLRAWWEEDREATEEYFHDMLGESGEAPQFCDPWVCEKIIRAHAKSPAMLAILPLQDWLSVDGAVRYPGDPKDERINVPAIPRYYWRYRMHLPLDGKDGLLSRESLSARIRGILADSARGI